ncbi:MAG: E3 binding domain-containing protein [Chloroflexi bacterium]|nr:E3 binding domain-containing protein [Chloroflexota bacterium]
MRVEVLVPQIGEAVAELILVAWHKRVGDKVEKGDLLFEIDSDKAIVEVDAFIDGTLTEIVEPDESAVMPQQVVAIIETADIALNVESGADVASLPASSPKTDEEVRRAAVETRPATEEQGGKFAEAPREAARAKISPKARRLAKAAGIDWTSISGSGADGMILVSDVESQIRATSRRKA